MGRTPTKRQHGATWRARLAAILTIVLPLACGLTLTLGEFGLAVQMRDLLFDQYQRMEPRMWRDDLPVRIIDIDDESLARYGQWPWPRDILARLTTRITQDHPAALVFDLIFAEEDRYAPERIVAALPASPEREALANVLAKGAGPDAFTTALREVPSVLALALLSQGELGDTFKAKAGFVELGDRAADSLTRFDHAVLPLPPYIDAAQGLGAINYLPDRDLVVRKVPIVFALATKAGTVLVPSLDAEALRVAQGSGTILLKSTRASGEASTGAGSALVEAKIGDAVLATERDGAVRVRFAGHQPERFIPAWRVIENEVTPQEIRDRILFVGTSAAALADLRSTPIDAAVPGVEIHAEMIEHALTNSRLARPDYARGIEALVLVLAGLMAGASAARLRPLTAALGTAALVGCIGAASWFAFQRADLLFDPMIPGATSLATFGAMTLRVYRRTERDKRHVRDAFSRYLAPAVVERLAADPSRLRLGGEARNLTTLFCDARDFTARAERLDAESVIAFLNALHTPLAAAVLAHSGTVDKFVGDGLMAFWNAPLDVPDHATKACAAALAMLESVPLIDARLSAASASEPAHVSIGIGINTGEAFVGNMGSEQRFDYSAAGDAVNIAARLESATKELHVPIVVSESTAREARGFHFLDLGEIILRGKSEPVRVFALHGREGEADEAFAAFSDLHRRALRGDEQALVAAARHPEGQRYWAFYRRLA
ncbi:MAG: adenylate/guanylate cyclase protein [Hyphomicrobiales bacterium]|nr:adenylate/guanylate cyclase protein [Hyphomicrobiales bacterium]